MYKTENTFEDIVFCTTFSARPVSWTTFPEATSTTHTEDPADDTKSFTLTETKSMQSSKIETRAEEFKAGRCCRATP